MYFDPWPERMALFQSMLFTMYQKSGCKCYSTGLEVSVSNEYVSISEALVLFVMKMTVLSCTGEPVRVRTASRYSQYLNMLVPPIQAAGWYCLNNYCYEDAVFLAERLHAEGINKRFKLTVTNLDCSEHMSDWAKYSNFTEPFLFSTKYHAHTHAVGSVDTSHLLATCYYRSGQVQQAKHHLSKEGLTSHPHCSLLYAQCCLTLKE